MSLEEYTQYVNLVPTLVLLVISLLQLLNKVDIHLPLPLHQDHVPSLQLLNEVDITTYIVDFSCQDRRSTLEVFLRPHMRPQLKNESIVFKLCKI